MTALCTKVHRTVKIQIYCFTLWEQKYVSLSVRGDSWPYKILQIRLQPGLCPDPLVGWGGGTPLPGSTPLGARLCTDKFCLKMPWHLAYQT